MISCLQNYIGAYNIQDNPTSGRYVNELSGITTDRIDQTYDLDDEYNVVNAWENIENVAIKKFEQRLQKWAKKFYLNYSYVDHSITGQYRGKTLVPVSNEYKGILFDYGFLTHRNLSIKTSIANLYAETAVDTTIYAFNAATGEEIESKSVSLTAGDNRIVLGWEFPVWRYPKVFICYDASEVETIKHDSYLWSSGTNIMYKQVSKSSEVLDSNLASSGQQNGLILNYNVVCSLDNFVCQRLELFEEPFIYCLATEILHQSVHSEEINRYTLLDYENAKILRDEYQVEFNEMIKETLQGLQMPDDKTCFVCNRQVNHRTMLP